MATVTRSRRPISISLAGAIGFWFLASSPSCLGSTDRDSVESLDGVGLTRVLRHSQARLASEGSRAPWPGANTNPGTHYLSNAVSDQQGSAYARQEQSRRRRMSDDQESSAGEGTPAPSHTTTGEPEITSSSVGSPAPTNGQPSTTTTAEDLADGSATPAPTAAAESTTTPAPTPSTPSPTSPLLSDTPAPHLETPVPSLVDSTTDEATTSAAMSSTTSSSPSSETQTESTTEAPQTSENSNSSSSSSSSSSSEKVSTPYFTDTSDHNIDSLTFYVQCDTQGATIRYTVDGSDPAPNDAASGDEVSSAAVHEVDPGEPAFVNDQIGEVTIRAVAVKDGMETSDEVSKTVTVQGLVEDPEVYYSGEDAGDESEADNAFLRTVTITMNCSTPNATIYYTTDGSTPSEESTPVQPGRRMQWSEEGTTTFKVVAYEDDSYHSEVVKSTVTIVAPRIDQHEMADTAGDEAGDMFPQLEITPFKAVYAAPGADLEQQEQLGPGYGEACEGGARIVTGKVIRVLNPARHVSFAAPEGACASASDDDDDANGGTETVLASASETSGAFARDRQAVELLDGETSEDARARLNLDAREEAWRAAGGNGCQAVAVGGLLGMGGGGGDELVGDRGCVVGHLVSDGNVINAEEETGLVSFGIRDGSYVIGVVTADEARDTEKPFQDLVSGAGWIVRAGVNHVEASARDGHLDILRHGGEEAGGVGEGLDDVLSAKLARTAIGHDMQGRLILLQTSGATTGADQDTSVPDGLDLFELADVLVEAGAVNAVNLAGGGPGAMTINGSAVVDTAEDCSEDRVDSGFVGDSALPRCERQVSSIVCVHLDPPPVLAGDEGSGSSSSSGGADGESGASSGRSSSDAGGDDWQKSWASDTDDGNEDARVQWAHDLCAENGTGNSTLWEHLDDVEEAVSRYKVAFWVAAALGMVSLYFNIHHWKNSASSASNGRGSGMGGAGPSFAKGAGLINGSVAALPGVEMAKVSSGKRGSRKGSSGGRRKGSSSGGGGAYARVQEEADWDGDDRGGPGGVYAMDSEEEVDLRPGRSRHSTSRKREKSKAGRLRRALSRVASGGGGSTGAAALAAKSEDARGRGADRSEDTMPINPFGRAGAGAGLSDVRREAKNYDYDVEGDWA